MEAPTPTVFLSPGSIVGLGAGARGRALGLPGETGCANAVLAVNALGGS